MQSVLPVSLQSLSMSKSIMPELLALKQIHYNIARADQGVMMGELWGRLPGDWPPRTPVPSF